MKNKLGDMARLAFINQNMALTLSQFLSLSSHFSFSS